MKTVAILLSILLIGCNSPKIEPHMKDLTVQKIRNPTIVEAKIIKFPPPIVYPRLALANKIQGVVNIKLTIDINGNVIKTEPIDGPIELYSTAVNYSKLHKFSPATLNGEPVNCIYLLSIPFVLKTQ